MGDPDAVPQVDPGGDDADTTGGVHPSSLRQVHVAVLDRDAEVLEPVPEVPLDEDLSLRIAPERPIQGELATRTRSDPSARQAELQAEAAVFEATRQGLRQL